MLGKQLTTVLSNFYAMLTLNYRKKFKKFQILWSDHIESAKKNNNVRFLSLLFPLTAFHNNLSSIFQLLLTIQTDIDEKQNGMANKTQRHTMQKRVKIVRAWFDDVVKLFVGAKITDLLAIANEYQNELGASTADGCDTVHLLEEEKNEILSWYTSDPSNPGDNCNAMANLAAKFEFEEKRVVCKTFGDNGVSYKMGKQKLFNQIKKMSNQVYEVSKKFYDNNISSPLLKLFKDLEACFDWKSYKCYKNENMSQATSKQFENLIKPLTEPMKTPKPNQRDVPPILDATLAWKEFEILQKAILMPNRMKNNDLSVGDRMELIYHYIAKEYDHQFPNVLKLMEWYTGQKLHMIDNERLNSKKTWILSSYRTNMSNDMLCAILRLQYGSKHVTEKLFHVALDLWLNAKKRRRVK